MEHEIVTLNHWRVGWLLTCVGYLLVMAVIFVNAGIQPVLVLTGAILFIIGVVMLIVNSFNSD